MRLPFRIKLAIQLAKLGQIGQSMGLSLMTADHLILWNQYYAEQVAVKRSLNKSQHKLSLSDEESGCINKLFPYAGNALILGCGEGREAIDLAAKGWQISGIDHSKKLVLNAELLASQHDLSIDFFCRNIALGLPRFIQPFHLITMLGQIYQYIPTRKRRIGLLRECKNLLAPNGYIVMTAPMIRPVFEREAKESLRMATFAKLFKGYHDREIGDQWEPRKEFHHWYPSKRDFDQEIKEAGFRQNNDSPFKSLSVLTPIKISTLQTYPAESLQ